MRVLVTESNPDVAEPVSAELVASGHEVVRCHAAGAASFPCAGLTAEGCPVEAGVDVAVTVRAHPRSTPAPTEDGVICALRRRVPVVVAGRTLFQPYSGFDVTELPDGGDVVAAVEHVARDRRPQHEAVAQPLLDEVLRSAGIEGAGEVIVTRSRSGLAVRLLFPPEADDRVRARASVRVTGAIRAYDTAAPQINVSTADV